MKSFITIIPASTQEKLVYATIKTMLSRKVEPNRIYGKKEFGYFSVYIDKDTAKCICRVAVKDNETALNLYFPTLNKNIEVMCLAELEEYAKYVYFSLLQL